MIAPGPEGRVNAANAEPKHSLGPPRQCDKQKQCGGEATNGKPTKNRRVQLRSPEMMLEGLYIYMKTKISLL